MIIKNDILIYKTTLKNILKYNNNKVDIQYNNKFTYIKRFNLSIGSCFDKTEKHKYYSLIINNNTLNKKHICICLQNPCDNSLLNNEKICILNILSKINVRYIHLINTISLIGNKIINYNINMLKYNNILNLNICKYFIMNNKIDFLLCCGQHLNSYLYRHSIINIIFTNYIKYIILMLNTYNNRNIYHLGITKNKNGILKIYNNKYIQLPYYLKPISKNRTKKLVIKTLNNNLYKNNILKLRMNNTYEPYNYNNKLFEINYYKQNTQNIQKVQKKHIKQPDNTKPVKPQQKKLYKPNK